MPIVNIADLKEGMIVAAAVKVQDRIMLDAGKPLTMKIIHILKAWGVSGVDVQTSGTVDVKDLGLDIPPAELESIKKIVIPRFKFAGSDEIIDEIQRICIKKIALEKIKRES